MERFSFAFRDKSVQSVFESGTAKFVQLSFDAGQGLASHRAKHNLSVIVLTGRIRFKVGEQEEILSASEAVKVAPLVEHAVEAIEKSTVLLVLAPDAQQTEQPDSAGTAAPKASALDHETAFQRPELVEQIAPALRSLIEDHVELCKVLDAASKAPGQADIQSVLAMIETELNAHFVAEEKVVFPRMAKHVGGADVGPVARLLEEHQHIRRLHGEAMEILSAWRKEQDNHERDLLDEKLVELSKVLMNHIGKEDSHLFPMASRILTEDELAAVEAELAPYKHQHQA